MILKQWYYDKSRRGECFFYPKIKNDNLISGFVFIYGNNDVSVDVITHYSEKDYDVMLSPNFASLEAKRFIIFKLFDITNKGILKF